MISAVGRIRVEACEVGYSAKDALLKSLRTSTGTSLLQMVPKSPTTGDYVAQLPLKLQFSDVLFARWHYVGLKRSNASVCETKWFTQLKKNVSRESHC